jgi:hypothetical protein
MNEWQEMYELTNTNCAQCEQPCCSVEYCDITEQYALAQGIVLQRTMHASIPFMGPNGCVVDPALRPLCTIHSCKDESFSDRYWDLRSILSDKMGEQ